jgi:hypothetical protein
MVAGSQPAGSSATAAAPRWWRSRCGRHSGRRRDRNAEGVDCGNREVGCNGNGFGPNCGPLSCAAGLYPLAVVWAELGSPFSPLWHPRIPNSHASPRRLKFKMALLPCQTKIPHHQHQKKNPSPPTPPYLSASRPQPTPPKLFENSPTKSQPRQPLPPLPATSPPPLPAPRRRHGNGLPHLRGRLRGQSPPLPRRLLARASASSRSQVRSSPSSRRTVELRARAHSVVAILSTLRCGALPHIAVTSSPVTRAPPPPPIPGRRRGRASPIRRGAAAPSTPSACSPSSPPSAASTLR